MWPNWVRFVVAAVAGGRETPGHCETFRSINSMRLSNDAYVTQTVGRLLFIAAVCRLLFCPGRRHLGFCCKFKIVRG